MARALHILSPGRDALASEVIRQALEAGDEVTVALLHGVAAEPLPAGAHARRVPEDLSWEELLEEAFAADHVIAW